MGVLENVREPRDLRRLSDDELTALAAEIRDVLVLTCSRTGGHLGPNLGTVELTIALHRVFDSPRDPILFDTGHQAYVHKLLTGRRDSFPTLRQQGGLSGYPSRSESEHDWIENSHASTALSYADGLSKGFAIRGERERTVVAVVGDGALTGGMAWEALNNIAGGPKGLPGERPARPVVIVVNDNGRSYAPTVGGVADHLAGLRTNPRYERVLDLIKRSLLHTPLVGQPLFDALHGIKKGLKDVLAPQGLFEDLGLKYIGPVDGHDRDAVEQALVRAKRFRAPVIVHCATQKGFGYEHAVRDVADQMHSPPAPFDPDTGKPSSRPGRTWTEVFARRAGRRRPGAARRRRDHRRHARPDRARRLRPRVPRPVLRRRHRRAACRDLRCWPGVGRHAPGRRRVRDVPEPGLRPGAHGRRAARMRGDVRPRPGRRHRRRRPLAQRHVGPVDPAGGTRECASPHPATAQPWSNCSTRLSTSLTLRQWSVSPRVSSGRIYPPWIVRAVAMCSPGPARATCW